jgi:hypothetical protein
MRRTIRFRLEKRIVAERWVYSVKFKTISLFEARHSRNRNGKIISENNNNYDRTKKVPRLPKSMKLAYGEKKTR